MLRISQLKLPVTHTEEDLKKKIVHTLMCRTEAVQSYEIIKQSLDARKKPELCNSMKQCHMFFRQEATKN